MTSNPTLTVKPRDITSAVGFIGRSSTAAGQQFRGRIKDFRVYSGVLTAGEVQALSDAAAAGNLAELVASVDLGDTSATTRNLALPSLPGVTWSTSDPAVITAQGEVTRPAAGRGDATGDADGHVHAPRADGVQGVPRHGQATCRHPARPAGGGPGALLQARRDRRDRADGLGHRRRSGHRDAGQPRQGRPGRRRRHAQPRRLRRRADRRARAPARRRHRGDDRAQRRLRHQDRSGQRRRPPPVELRAQDELRRDREQRLRRLDLRLQHRAPAHRPERHDAHDRRERATLADLRAARRRVEAPDLHATAQRGRGDAGPGSCTRTAWRSGATPT